MWRALFLSVLLLMSSMAFGQDDLARVERELAGKTGPAAQNAATKALAELPDLPTPIIDKLTHIQATGSANDLQELRAMIRSVRSISGPLPPPATTPSTRARELKQTPLYRDQEEVKRDNWLTRALQRIAELFRFRDTKKTETFNPQTNFGTGWITTLAWALLAIVVVTGAAFAIYNFRGKWGWKRSAAKGGLLDDDEPDRTADEWIVQADALAMQGKHREAIRALYLACLVRLDEARVIRFVRGETNWEHLRRYEASPARLDLDLRHVTQRFDVIWYGYRTNGAPDFNEFKEVYQALCQKLAQVAR